MRRNFETTYENWGKYTTVLYTEEVKNLIKSHNNSEIPFFLTISHTAVHSGNPYGLLQAPLATVKQFSYIENIPRRTYAAMVSELDKSVGETILAIATAGLLENSIIIFMTDNGGPANGFNGNAASNWPLRGVKNTLWEGGVRGVGIIWSPLLKQVPRVSAQLVHVQDWLPTLMKAIGGNKSKLGDIDGLDMWESLMNGGILVRNEILHNIDDIYGNEAIRKGKWKLLHGKRGVNGPSLAAYVQNTFGQFPSVYTSGTTYDGNWDGWYGPSGFEKIEDIIDNSNGYNKSTQFKIVENALNSMSAKSIKSLQQELFPNTSTLINILEESRISCETRSHNPCNLKGGDYCLFNVVEDPCEHNNLAAVMPDKVHELQNVLLKYHSNSVQPINKPKDPRGQPKYWNYTWTNWMDFVEPQDSSESLVC